MKSRDKALVKTVRDQTPRFGPGTFLAESSDIIGDVVMGSGCSVWYQTVIRGDVMPIRIGDETNIQDQVMIHGTYKKAATTLGKRVSVGHKVMLHGCEVGDGCLIGMGAILMDHVKVAPRNLIAAGSLLTEGSEFLQEGNLILGSPARVKRKLTDEELRFLIKSADNYILYKSWYEQGDQ